MHRVQFILLAIGIFAITAAGVYWYVSLPPSDGLDPVQVAAHNLREEVEISGLTKASTQVDLSFKTPGKINSISTTVGARVATSTTLMGLDSNEKLTSPIAGIVAMVEPTVGEVVAAGVPVVMVVGNGPIKIEGYVPEVHYAHLAVGQPVRITFVAFPNQEFSGTLERIDPIATPVNGVPNFKVTVRVSDPDSLIKPGLTANAFIRTADKKNVPAIPEKAVHASSLGPTVIKRIGNNQTKVPIGLGVTSSDGYVEVVSGLSLGDTILVDNTKVYKIVPND
jgi:multidrug efflux pump subunit AcrA (membrane-fusion protein)